MTVRPVATRVPWYNYPDTPLTPQLKIIYYVAQRFMSYACLTFTNAYTSGHTLATVLPFAARTPTYW